ncbi:MAG: dTMP kinase [Dokdonella sp.]|uniref:dTMP kinase n=1 Tax=Dokdonella sp. TaxID=2291710 RepID=UPI0025C243C9|nr:dTMP kinase [Dokdonella sp.]MBZ0222519.1 dTMP kinase [Dokdonella sp.]MCC7256107.1 dTMP kinase [Dokdonella sp.]
MNGRLITLEGGEGAGKSSVLDALRERLASRGIDVVVTREPGGTAFGEAARALMLDPAHAGLCAESELLLVFAARAQHVRERIAPALARGQWVLSDRYTDASYAYQGGGRGQPLERIAALEAWAAPVRADLTLLLDLPIEQGLARAGARGPRDRIEAEGAAFFERVRGTYRQRAAQEPQRFRSIDASQPLEAVRAAACAELDAFLDSAGVKQ